MIKSPKVTRVLVVRRWTANFAPPHSAEANWQACIGDYDIDLELNELCGNFGEALSASFPALSTGGGTAPRCDQFVLTILYVPFLCPMIKAMPS